MGSGCGERPELVLDSILPLRPRLGQDVSQLATELWAIHGFIPVDGEVILAEFDHYETATAVLNRLAAAQDFQESGTTAPICPTP